MGRSAPTEAMELGEAFVGSGAEGGSSNGSGRGEIWKAARHVASDHPVQGIGFGALCFCHASHNSSAEKEKTTKAMSRCVSIIGLKAFSQGTGSYPPAHQGWQRARRCIASIDPRRDP